MAIGHIRPQKISVLATPCAQTAASATRPSGLLGTACSDGATLQPPDCSTRVTARWMTALTRCGFVGRAVPLRASVWARDLATGLAPAAAERRRSAPSSFFCGSKGCTMHRCGEYFSARSPLAAGSCARATWSSSTLASTTLQTRRAASHGNACRKKRRHRLPRFSPRHGDGSSASSGSPHRRCATPLGACRSCSSRAPSTNPMASLRARSNGVSGTVAMEGGETRVPLQAAAGCLCLTCRGSTAH